MYSLAGQPCCLDIPVYGLGGELDLPECVREDRWLQLSSVERAIYNRTYAALETSVRQTGLLRQKQRAAPDGRKHKTCTTVSVPKDHLMFLSEKNFTLRICAV